MEDFKADLRGVEYGLLVLAGRASSDEMAADWLIETCFERSFLFTIREGVAFGLPSGCGSKDVVELNGEFDLEEKLSGMTLGKEGDGLSGCCWTEGGLADPKNLRTPFIPSKGRARRWCRRRRRQLLRNIRPFSSSGR